MKKRLVVPVFVFWALLHADHGFGFFKSYGLYDLADFYHYHMSGIYEGINPILFVVMLTAATCLPVWGTVVADRISKRMEEKAE